MWNFCPAAGLTSYPVGQWGLPARIAIRLLVTNMRKNLHFRILTSAGGGGRRLSIIYYYPSGPVADAVPLGCPLLSASGPPPPSHPRREQRRRRGGPPPSRGPESKRVLAGPVLWPYGHCYVCLGDEEAGGEAFQASFYLRKPLGGNGGGVHCRTGSMVKFWLPDNRGDEISLRSEA